MWWPPHGTVFFCPTIGIWLCRSKKSIKTIFPSQKSNFSPKRRQPPDQSNIHSVIPLAIIQGVLSVCQAVQWLRNMIYIKSSHCKCIIPDFSKFIESCNYHHNSDLEQLFGTYPQKFPLAHLKSIPTLSLSPGNTALTGWNTLLLLEWTAHLGRHIKQVNAQNDL